MRGNNVHAVQDIVSGELCGIHVIRMPFYTDQAMNVSVDFTMCSSMHSRRALWRWQSLGIAEADYGTEPDLLGARLFLGRAICICVSFYMPCFTLGRM